jgi:acyl carrier protein
VAPPSDVDLVVYAGVQRCFCETLELDSDEVSWDSKVLDDLGAESIDLLDVAFRLETTFDIQIPRGGVEAQAKDVDGEPGEVDGRLTEVGAVRLRELMPEVPEAEIYEGMKTSEIAMVFRVGTFYNIVKALVEAKTA